MGGGMVQTPGQSDTILNDQAIDQFRQLPGVVAATPLLNLQSGGGLRLNRYTGFASMQGIDTLALRDFNYEVQSGTAFEQLGHGRAGQSQSGRLPASVGQGGVTQS
jgi:hypothetical protein